MLELQRPQFTCNKTQVVILSQSLTARNTLNMQNKLVPDLYLEAPLYSSVQQTTISSSHNAVNPRWSHSICLLFEKLPQKSVIERFRVSDR